jgi:hypothetical protein
MLFISMIESEIPVFANKETGRLSMTSGISCNRRKLERVFVDPVTGWLLFERRQEIQRKKKPGSPRTTGHREMIIQFGPSHGIHVNVPRTRYNFR